MSDGANSFDIATILHFGKTVSSTDTTAKNGRIGTFITSGFTLSTSGTKFHDVSWGVGGKTRNSSSLSSDKRVEVHGLKKIGFNQDGTDHVAFDTNHRNLWIADTAFF